LVRILGNPDHIYKNKSQREMWTYTKQAFNSDSGILGGGIVLYGMTGFASPGATAYDLIVEWEKDSVVRNFTVVTSNL